MFRGVVSALAACELEVPRLVIGQRSCQEAMRILEWPAKTVDALWQGYRAVSENSAVVMLNNSAAGAAGYEHWLRLRRGTIRVLYSGYMPGSARKPTVGEVADFRASLGWTPGSPVVGTIMRFVKDKDPDLWLDTAAAHTPTAIAQITSDGT